MWLCNQGFEQVQSLAGGIDAWSRTIDPAIPATSQSRLSNFGQAFLIPNKRPSQDRNVSSTSPYE
jgi:hypothetical protein